ncbi:MAG: LysR substrate-binding domain-containing protein, partial [Pseudomonadota bacterium]
DVELTPLGLVFLDRARAALDDLESAMLGITDIAASRTGRVTVACVPSAAIYFLPSVVSSFSERYPQMRIRVIDEAASQVLASVVSGESDFGISFMGNQVPGVEFDPIHTDPFVIAMPRQHALAGRSSLDWAELLSERLIAVARSSGNRQLLDDALAKAGVNPSYRFEVSHIATLLGMVEAGLGLAAVPRLSLSPTHPSLVGVALTGPAVSRVLGLATRRGAALRAPARMFHDYLRAALKDRR